MISHPDASIAEPHGSATRVHVLGAGPVGLVVTALLQSNDRFAVHLYEKRRDYSRTRMVQLAPFLVADSIASYCVDYIDGESVEAIFAPAELAEGLAFRESIPTPDGTSAGMDAGVLSTQRHRARPERAHRCAPRAAGRAHPGGRLGGRRDGDAAAGRHPDRLHGDEVGAEGSAGGEGGGRGGRGGSTGGRGEHPSRCGSSTRS
jgi:hypothetical protein